MSLPSPTAKSAPTASYPISNCRVTAALSITMPASLARASSSTNSIRLDDGYPFERRFCSKSRFSFVLNVWCTSLAASNTFRRAYTSACATLEGSTATICWTLAANPDQCRHHRRVTHQGAHPGIWYCFADIKVVLGLKGQRDPVLSRGESCHTSRRHPAEPHAFPNLFIVSISGPSTRTQVSA